MLVAAAEAIATALQWSVDPDGYLVPLSTDATVQVRRNGVMLLTGTSGDPADGLRIHVIPGCAGDPETNQPALGDSLTRLLIPAYDIDSDDIYLFRPPHSPHLRRDWRVPMVDVALATSAAPGYFAPHRVHDVRMMDGGIYANSPAMLALTEAVRFCGQPSHTVHMLSLGTTDERRKVDAGSDGGGLFQRRHSLVGHALRGQSRVAENHPRLLLGDARFHRLDPIVPKGIATLDELDPRELISRARSDSRHLSARLTDFFAHQPAAFRPLYPALETTP